MRGVLSYSCGLYVSCWPLGHHIRVGRRYSAHTLSTIDAVIELTDLRAGLVTLPCVLPQYSRARIRNSSSLVRCSHPARGSSKFFLIIFFNE
jgi:hypothetical protein